MDRSVETEIGHPCLCHHDILRGRRINGGGEDEHDIDGQALKNRNQSANPNKESRGCQGIMAKFVLIIFSTLGTTATVLAYIVMGGFLFQCLEQGYENDVRQNVAAMRMRYVDELSNLTDSRDIWSRQVEDILRELQLETFRAIKNDGWDGREHLDHLNETSPSDWNYPSSLLYSVTVVTTIGYGNISPRTTAGRIVTIIYAMFGIPLTLLYLSNIGGMFAAVFRLGYKHISAFLKRCCCPPKRSPKGKNKSKNALDNGECEKTHELNPDPQHDSPDHASPLKHVAALSPTSHSDRGGNEQDSAIGTRQDASPNDRSLHAGAPEPGNDAGALKTEKDQTSQNKKRFVPGILKSPKDSPHQRMGIGRKSNKFKRQLKEEVRIPLTTSVGFICIYIVGGSAVFSLWEQEWSFLEAVYFVFITLSTIGFGDFVFGTDGDIIDQKKLIFCAVYLSVGLSVIAMAFDLMQDEVRAKFRWLGKRLGILS